MTVDIKNVEQIDLDEYTVNHGDERQSWFYAQIHAWRRESVSNTRRYDSHEYVRVTSFIAFFVGFVTLLLCAPRGFTHPVPLAIFAVVVSTITFGELWIRRLRRKERLRLSSIPSMRREWHARLTELIRRIEGFNARLHAFKLYAENAEPGQEVDPAVSEKYLAERQELVALKRKLMRDHAAVEFENACAKDDNGFRETRDLSDAVFMNRVRLSAEDDRAVEPVIESPLEERFRALEEEQSTGKSSAGA